MTRDSNESAYYFDSIADSILVIFNNSSNESFRSDCLRAVGSCGIELTKEEILVSLQKKWAEKDKVRRDKQRKKNEGAPNKVKRLKEEKIIKPDCKQPTGDTSLPVDEEFASLPLTDSQTLTRNQINKLNILPEVTVAAPPYNDREDGSSIESPRRCLLPDADLLNESDNATRSEFSHQSADSNAISDEENTRDSSSHNVNVKTVYSVCRVQEEEDFLPIENIELDNEHESGFSDDEFLPLDDVSSELPIAKASSLNKNNSDVLTGKCDSNLPPPSLSSHNTECESLDEFLPIDESEVEITESDNLTEINNKVIYSESDDDHKGEPIDDFLPIDQFTEGTDPVDQCSLAIPGADIMKENTEQPTAFWRQRRCGKRNPRFQNQQPPEEDDECYLLQSLINVLP